MTDNTALTLAKNILDEAFDPNLPTSEPVYGLPSVHVADAAFTDVAVTVSGWTPPPREDSAFYTPLCAHREEVAYEWDMELAARFRRAADEIQAARHATYPHLVTPLKKRRTPKKAAKA